MRIDTASERVRQRGEIGHGRRLAGIERRQDRLAPAAGRKIDEVGTFPAAIFRLSAGALIALPSMNWLWVQTEATLVISLTMTMPRGLAPSTTKNLILGLSPAFEFAADGRPPR